MWTVFLLVFVPVCSGVRGTQDEFPREDYKTFFKDLNEALGLEQILDSIGFYFRTYIRIGLFYILLSKFLTKKIENKILFRYWHWYFVSSFASV